MSDELDTFLDIFQAYKGTVSAWHGGFTGHNDVRDRCIALAVRKGCLEIQALAAWSFCSTIDHDPEGAGESRLEMLVDDFDEFVQVLLIK